MEEDQDDSQFSLGLGLHLTSWGGVSDQEEGEVSAQNYTAGPFNDLKRASKEKKGKKWDENLYILRKCENL